MLGLFLNAFVAVRTAHGTPLVRAQSERGATMVEYALVLGLIVVVVVVVVIGLGQALPALFNSANTCVGGLNSTSC